MHPKEERGRADEGPKPEAPMVTREIAAEAAVWIARLHGPDRSIDMERECLAWQACSAVHRLAFERGTDLWMEVAGVNRSAVARAALDHRPDIAARGGRFKAWSLAAALTTMLLAGMMVFEPWRGGSSYDTGVGEQRIVMLQDGTRMSLNTSTQVRVALGASRRTVEVIRGEALFEVAKDASRPFLVRAAGSEVQATGTAFVVRYMPALVGSRDAVDITLIEGRVVVRGAAVGMPVDGLTPGVDMAPGERLRFVGGARGQVGVELRPLVDRPRVDQVLAWKRGEAIFDNASLADAVGEMNRYSATQIRLAEAATLGGLRISGVFKTGDNVSFARAVAALHGLEVRESADRLELVPS